jgi:CBS domain-containing protein
VEIPEKIRKIINGHGWLKHVRVCDIMEPNVITISEEATLKRLDALITEHKHSGYPVVNTKRKITGVITHKDLLRVEKDNWDKVRVKERMSTCLICVSPEDSVIDAVETMTRAGVGRLLVMDRDKLVGIVSRSCIMDKVIKRMVT